MNNILKGSVACALEKLSRDVTAGAQEMMPQAQRIADNQRDSALEKRAFMLRMLAIATTSKTIGDDGHAV